MLGGRHLRMGHAWQDDTVDNDGEKRSVWESFTRKRVIIGRCTRDSKKMPRGGAGAEKDGK